MLGKILLADDDESVRKMVARVLESADYQVLTAGSGREAISICATQSPELVLLDLELCDPAAWSVVEVIRQRQPGIPVIALSAWPNQVKEATRRGTDALMEKPLDLPQLLSSVRRLLKASPQQNEHTQAAGVKRR